MSQLCGGRAPAPTVRGRPDAVFQSIDVYVAALVIIRIVRRSRRHAGKPVQQLSSSRWFGG